MRICALGGVGRSIYFLAHFKRIVSLFDQQPRKTLSVEVLVGR